MALILGAIFVGLFLALPHVHSKVVPEIKCSPRSLDVRVRKDGVKSVELEKWSVIPGCESISDKEAFIVHLNLSSDLPCGTTRIRNKLTEDALYYHKLAIVDAEGQMHLFKVSCFVSHAHGVESNIVKRNVLPPEFVEPDYIEITSEVTGTAPNPELTVGVRQNGNLIGNQITVSPGAPLQMEVYLDSQSSSIYGILVSYLMVTDTTDKNETIIFNGCTQDSYVFENFEETMDGDFLTAKFRAFKFPESSYLLFRGTVDVCLDRCQGIQCSSGDIGYGRRRRAIPERADPNKIFEVTMMTFIEVDNTQLEPDSPFIRHGDAHRKPLPSLAYEIKEEESSLMTKRTSEQISEEEQAPPPFIVFYSGASFITVNILHLLLGVLAVTLSSLSL